MTGKAYDYVIVGAGAAGCTLASRLSENPDCTVLLLEAGARPDHPSIPEPEAWSRLQGSRIDWGLRTEPQDGLGGRMVSWPRGKVVGGSTAMNAMVYLRGRPADYDRWGGSDGPWSGGAMWEVFDQAEISGELLSDPTVTGVRVSRPDPHPWCTAFMASAVQAGVPPNEDFNRTGTEGVGLYTVTKVNGVRQSAADGYLRPAGQRPNLDIRSEARVLRLRVDGSAVRGVEYLDGAHQQQSIVVNGEVVLAAGAVGSPHLLLLSGIGPAAHLERLAIPIHVDLPEVGHNLHDHIAASITFSSKEPDPLDRRGGLGDAGAFVQTEFGTHGADLHLWLSPATSPEGMSFSIGVGLTQPESRGRLSLRDADPNQPPIIDPGYLSAAADVRRLSAGLRLAREFADNGPVGELHSGPVEDPSPDESQYVRRFASTSFHPVGTCRMGNDSGAVVNEELRVQGITNLRVADASIMPTITTGGTQAPTFSIAEKAAQLIRRERTE